MLDETLQQRMQRRAAAYAQQHPRSHGTDGRAEHVVVWQPGEVIVRTPETLPRVAEEQSARSHGGPREKSRPVRPAEHPKPSEEHSGQSVAGRPALSVAQPTAGGSAPPPANTPAEGTHATVGIPDRLKVAWQHLNDPWSWWDVALLIALAFLVFLVLCWLSKRFEAVACWVLTWFFRGVRLLAKGILYVLVFVASICLRGLGFLAGIAAKGGQALVMTHVFRRPQDQPMTSRSYPRRKVARRPIRVRF